MRRSSFAAVAFVLGLVPFVASARAPSVGDGSLGAFPIPDAPPVPGSNVQLGSDTDVVAVALDWESANGYLFAALLRSNGDLRLLRSTNGGASWTNPGNAPDDATALDAIVVGDSVLLAYAVGSELRLRRASSSTGALDGSYGVGGVRTIADVSPATIQEIAVVSDADALDDTFWLFAITSANRVVAFWGPVSSGGLGESMTGVYDAREGLSAAWNVGYPSATPSSRSAMFAYVTTSNEVHVVKKHATEGWQASNMYWTGGAAEETSITAYHDHVVVAWELLDLSGDQDAAFMTSADGGYGWSVVPYFAADLENGDFYHPLVTSRSGTGTAFALLQEKGAIDTISLRTRCNYSGGAWSSPEVLNDDSSPADDGPRGNDFEWLGSGWALGYLDELGQAWFTWSESIRYSGFECGDLDDWSGAVGGP